LLYEELKVISKKLGFNTIDEFGTYIGVTPADVLRWQRNRRSSIYGIAHNSLLLKGEVKNSLLTQI